MSSIHLSDARVELRIKIQLSTSPDAGVTDVMNVAYILNLYMNVISSYTVSYESYRAD